MSLCGISGFDSESAVCVGMSVYSLDIIALSTHRLARVLLMMRLCRHGNSQSLVTLDRPVTSDYGSDHCTCSLQVGVGPIR